MDGKLSCTLNAEAAAFTKLRHLENRVVEVETKLDNIEQLVPGIDTSLQDAITNLKEKVETENVDTTSLNADIIEAVNVVADNINTLDLTATAIEAETIDVANLENVNVLHGVTVDVEQAIATIGQFTETQTTTANNGTTNTEELNVSTEANLTGQVNIDGDVTFTKADGLSKLQGEYLEIDAASVVINNEDEANYALYAPGIYGKALFGGSVAVQDTLLAKNLMVVGETFFKEGIVLDNPVLKNITESGYSTTALDVDANGKLVKVKLAAEVSGAVESLEANTTRYTSELNPSILRSSDDSDFVFQVDANTFLTVGYDSERPDEALAILPNGDVADPYTTCSHLDNIYYIKGSEYLKYNFTNGTTSVVAQIDTAKTYVTMHIFFGKVLDEDIPAYYCSEDNKMYSLLDGSELAVSFTINADTEVNTVYADKNGTTYIDIVFTDTSFNSILDEGQGVLFNVPNSIDGSSGKGIAVDCPAAILTDNSAGIVNGGQIIDIGNAFTYRLAKDDTYIFNAIGLIYTYNVGGPYSEVHNSTIYNYGYFAGFDYIITTPHTEKMIEVSTENVFIAKSIPVEINGKYFVDGRWYDKVVTSYEEFMQFIVDTEQNYVSENDYSKCFDVLYNNAGSEVISNNPWSTVTSTITSDIKHTYRLIGLRSNMNGDGYFGSNGMTKDGACGEIKDIQSVFTIKQNYDFFAPPSRLAGKLLYENIEFNYSNGFFTSSYVNDLKNCNIFIEGQWTNSASSLTFEHCENVYFIAEDINFDTGTATKYFFNGCNGMFVDTLISSFQPAITINLSNMLLIKCTSNDVTQYGPGSNARYSGTGRADNITLV